MIMSEQGSNHLQAKEQSGCCVVLSLKAHWRCEWGLTVKVGVDADRERDTEKASCVHVNQFARSQ